MKTSADTPIMDTLANSTPTAMRALPSFIAPAAPGMPDPVVTYHADNLTVERVEYHNTDGNLHRNDGPAYTEWHANGVKSDEQWYRNGEIGREDGPAHTVWHAHGVQSYEQWWPDGQQISVPSRS